LRRLKRDFGSSIILITHDMGVVAEMADRVLVMYAGRVVESGPCDAVFDNPWHPYTWGLLDSIPPLDGPRPERLASIPGSPPQPGRWPSGCVFGPRCGARFAPCAERPPKSSAGEHEAHCFINANERAKTRAKILGNTGQVA
jgi:peptide/nickel transport system ATP-binding protein